MLNVCDCTQPSQHLCLSDYLKFVSEDGQVLSHLFLLSWVVAKNLTQASPLVLMD